MTRLNRLPRRVFRDWRLAAGAAAILILAGVFIWRDFSSRPYKRTDYLLGTLVEITAYGPRARAGVDEAFAAMREVERLTDPGRPDSDLARLAAAAGRGPVAVDGQTMDMLRLAKEWWNKSGGAFDATIAPVVAAWGFNPGGEPHLPDQAEITKALQYVDGAGLILDEGAGTAFLARSGMQIDLGGLAKGYAVDRAYDALTEAGVRSALIDGGQSSIRVLGRPPHGGAWRIGLADPRSAPDRRAFLAVLTLEPGQALGTSADNQNYFMAGGRRYSHLIDPRTGYPADSCALFTVENGSAAVADILSTACFVSGPAAGMTLARENGTEGLVYTADGKIEKSPGLKEEPE